NRLRVSTTTQTVLDEVALAVQGAGDFDCVTLSQIDWSTATAQVVVAIGASGHRLAAVEGLQIPWNEFAVLLDQGDGTINQGRRPPRLPFPPLKREKPCCCH